MVSQISSFTILIDPPGTVRSLTQHDRTFGDGVGDGGDVRHDLIEQLVELLQFHQSQGFALRRFPFQQSVQGTLIGERRPRESRHHHSFWAHSFTLSLAATCRQAEWNCSYDCN